MSYILNFLESKSSKIKTATLKAIYNLDPVLSVLKSYEILEYEKLIGVRR